MHPDPITEMKKIANGLLLIANLIIWSEYQYISNFSVLCFTGTFQRSLFQLIAEPVYFQVLHLCKISHLVVFFVSTSSTAIRILVLVILLLC